jgi:ATP-dependent Clp protease ATP-binding subunit ClpC
MDENMYQEEMQENKKAKKGKTESKTPMLDSFGKDITKMAMEGKLDPVVGRDKEIDRVIQVLGRRKKNNPVLVGGAGTGKSCIIEGIAKKIIEGKTSRILFGKRIVTLDLSTIVAGTKYRGQFEERMKVIIEEIEANPDIIIFIDEIHTIIGAGNSQGSLDASNILKPALARGTMQCIGATTIDEYKKSIEREAALERRFQKILIDPSTVEETKEILTNIKEYYEQHHNVLYTPEAIDACVYFADRYITSRFFPDKAIDIMDETGSKVHLDNLNVPEIILNLEQEIKESQKAKAIHINMQEFEKAANARDKERVTSEKLEIEKKKWNEEQSNNKIKITEDMVALVVSSMIGIPVTKMTEDEGVKLLNMPNELKKRVVGQDEAVEKVSEAIQRSRTNLQSPARPLVSLIFLGGTGQGKTELCKVLAEYLFGTKDCLIKLDMSEYMESHTVSKMIGSPPGYVGYEEGGQLTEMVRNKPYSVVLFDEIEKAHPDVSNILLQILDEGKLTDSLGRTVDFKNTIIIMTSNIGTKELNENKPMGYSGGNSVAAEMNVSNIIAKALKKVFRPEFINRIDEQVIFKNLSEDNIKEIVKINLKELVDRIKLQEYDVKITDNLINFLAKEGFSDEFGARPVLRAIIKYVQNPVSKELLLKTFKKGDTIVVDYDKKTKEVKVSKKK